MTRIPLPTAAATLSETLTPTPASSSPPPVESLQARVDAALAAFPGGVQIADDSIAWEDGGVVLTLEGGSSAQSLGTCSPGSYCAWSQPSYSGSKLTFTACSLGGTSSSLAPLGTNARSLANARPSGTVKAKNGSTVVLSLGPSVGIPSNSATLTTMVCFT